MRGTGIAKRSPEYVKQKMLEGKAIIALDGDKFVGFSYIECWSNRRFVANSGLIVANDYRGRGVAMRIKRQIFSCHDVSSPTPRFSRSLPVRP